MTPVSQTHILIALAVLYNSALLANAKESSLQLSYRSDLDGMKSSVEPQLSSTLVVSHYLLPDGASVCIFGAGHHLPVVL